MVTAEPLEPELELLGSALLDELESSDESAWSSDESVSSSADDDESVEV